MKKVSTMLLAVCFCLTTGDFTFAQPVERPESPAAVAAKALELLRKHEYDAAQTVVAHAAEKFPDDFTLLVAHAKILAAIRKPSEARELLTKAATLKPEDVGLELALAAVALAEKKFAEAEAAADRAIKLDEECEEAYVSRAEARWWLDKDKAALDDANHVIININPLSPRAFNVRGNVWRRMGEKDKAMSDYCTAIDLDPKWWSPYNNRGVLHRDNDDYSKALADFDRAIALTNIFGLPYLNKAHVLREHSRDSKAALEYYVKALKLDPDSENALFGLGRCYENMRNASMALEYFDKAIEVNPKCAPAFYHRGSVYEYILRKHDKALENYTQFIALEPDDEDGYFRRALVLKMSGKNEQADADFSKAIEIKPNWSSPYLYRGEVRAARGKYAEAVADYTKAIELQGGNWLAYQRRAYTRILMCDFENALADATEGVRLNEGFSWGHNLKGRALMALGRYDEALKFLENGRARSPKDPTPPFYVGLIYHITGRPDEAAEEFGRHEAVIEAGNSPASIKSHRMRQFAVARHLALLSAGRNDEALAAIDRAIATNQNNPGYRIMQAYARMRADTDAGNELTELAKRHKSNTPGGMLLDFYFNKAAPDKYIESQKGERIDRDREQRTFANYVVALKYLMDDDTAAATKYFRAAVEVNEPTQSMHHMAKIFLENAAQGRADFLHKKPAGENAAREPENTDTAAQIDAGNGEEK